MAKTTQHEWLMANMAIRIAQCEAKIAFETKGNAMKYTDRKAGGGRFPYQCDICGHWHLTKTEHQT